MNIISQLSNSCIFYPIKEKCESFNKNLNFYGLDAEQSALRIALIVDMLAVGILLLAPEVLLLSDPERIRLTCEVSFLGVLLFEAILMKEILTKMTYANFAKGKDGANAFCENIYLILRAKEDWNGALDRIGLSEVIQLEKQKEYTVVCRDVGTLKEFSDVIEELGVRLNKIKVLEILAHGNSKYLRLGKGNSDSLITKDTILSVLSTLRKIEENATIILRSCKTGYIDDAGDASIAQSIAEQVAGRTVIAPIVCSSPIDFTYNFEPFNVQINRIFENDTAEKIVDLINHHLILFGYQLKGSLTMTGRFRSYSSSSPV